MNDVKTLVQRYPEAFVEVDHPVAGKQKLSGPPTLFSDAKVDNSVPAPLLGQHTDEILTSLGYTDDAILVLRKQGVV